MDDFRFESVVHFSEEEYLDQMHGRMKSTFRSKLVGVIVALLGIIMLFNPYTAGIGVLLFLFIPFGYYIAGKSGSDFLHKDIYRDAVYLNEKAVHGVSRDKCWLKSDSLNLSFDWICLKVWEEKSGWLELRSNSLPTIFLPIDKLKSQGVYDRILSLCKKNGIEFDKCDTQHIEQRRKRIQQGVDGNAEPPTQHSTP